jgi:hypothetical protein
MNHITTSPPLPRVPLSLDFERSVPVIPAVPAQKERSESAPGGVSGEVVLNDVGE